MYLIELKLRISSTYHSKIYLHSLQKSNFYFSKNAQGSYMFYGFVVDLRLKVVHMVLCVCSVIVPGQINIWPMCVSRHVT